MRADPLPPPNVPAKGIRCPACKAADVPVYCTKPLPGGRVRQYRKCEKCKRPFITSIAVERPAAK